MDVDVPTLIGRIEADALALDQASKDLHEIQSEYVAAAVAYEDAEDVALRDVEAEYEEKGTKLPSERQRLAHARPRIDAEVRLNFKRLEARRKLTMEWTEIRRAALSARQSELRALRDESSAPEPQWSRR